MKNRILALFLAVIMTFGMIPNAFAAENTETTAATEESIPETTVAEESIPETTVVEESIPETTVVEESIPETTVVEESVPETTTVVETIPETTVSEETVPETTAAAAEESTEVSLKSEVDGKTFEVSGAIPDGASAVVEQANVSIMDALAGLNIVGTSVSLFDISVEVDGEKWQPGSAVMLLDLDSEPVDSTVTLSVDGLDVEAGDPVTVYHLFDSPIAIANAFSMGAAYQLDVTGNEELFTAELEAAELVGGDEGVIFYEVINTTVGSDGTVTFETGSFSTYVLATGNTTKGAQASITHLIMQNGVTNTYYVMPDTTITFYSSSTTQNEDNYKITLGSSASWDVGSNSIGLKDGTGSTYVMKIPAGAANATITLKANGGTAKVVITDKATVVKNALNTTDKIYEVYLTCITDPQNGLPGEPGVNTRKFNIIRSNYSVHKSSGNTGELAFSNGNPANVINSSIASEAQFVTSTDGTCTLGLVDPSGILTKKYIKLTESQWTTVLKNLASTEGKNGYIYATDGKKVTSSNYTNYAIVPYVVKLQTVSGFSWNIDCYVVPMKSAVSLSYNFNLPSGRYTEKAVPATKTGYNSFSATISNVLGNKDATVTLTDKDGGEYKYRFLGWGLTTSSGRDATYDPGKTVTIKKNTMLYAQWTPLYKYTLIFDPNGGTGDPADQTQNWTTASSKTFTWTEEPTRDKYQFAGWSTDGKNDTVEINAGTKSYKMTGTAGKEVSKTLYAVWKPMYRYVLKFDPNGGTGDPVDQTKNWTTASTHTFTWSGAPTRTGYKFVGWSVGANDNTAEIAAGTTSYKVTGKKLETVTTNLYACWEPLYRYVLTFDPNGGAGDPVDQTQEWTEASTHTFNWTAAPTRAGYTFAGWSVNANDNSAEIPANTASYKVTGVKATTVTTDLYACWTINKYPYQFNYLDIDTNQPIVAPVEGEANYQSEVTGKKKDIADYEFEKVEPNPDKITISTNELENVINYYYKENTVVINYQVVGPDGCGTVNLNDGNTTPAGASVSESMKVLSGEAKGATAAHAVGFKFVGWFKSPECAEADRVASDTQASYAPDKADGKNVAATYYAKFEYELLDLTVTKTVSGSTYGNQSFVFTLSGTSKDGKVSSNATFVLNQENNYTVTIKDLPYGNYTVSEENGWSWEFSDASAQDVELTSDQTVNFANTRDKFQWLTWEAAKNNLFDGQN